MWQRMTDATYACKFSICATMVANHLTLSKVAPVPKYTNQYWERTNIVVGGGIFYLYIHAAFPLIIYLYDFSSVVIWYLSKIKVTKYDR